MPCSQTPAKIAVTWKPSSEVQCERWVGRAPSRPRQGGGTHACAWLSLTARCVTRNGGSHLDPYNALTIVLRSPRNRYDGRRMRLDSTIFRETTTELGNPIRV